MSAHHDSLLDSITRKLQKHTQRATYKAVGAQVGLPAQSVGGMLGERNSQRCWVVAKKTGHPTGYKPGEMDPTFDLTTKPPIDSADELAAWLKNHT